MARSSLHSATASYQVRGLHKNTSYELLRVNVLWLGMNLRGETGYHVDTLDLNSGAATHGVCEAGSRRAGHQGRVIRQRTGPRAG